MCLTVSALSIALRLPSQQALREAKTLNDAFAATGSKNEVPHDISNAHPQQPGEQVKPAPQVQPPKTPKHDGTPSVLMVGGTDGSGTRSIVVMLQQLGVRMVVDDKGTQDVHAATMGGWPPPVAAVVSVNRNCVRHVQR